MNLPTFHIVVLGSVCTVLMAASTVEAAKGVKKATLANGQYLVTGTVMTMAPDGNGGGMFQLKTANQHKKSSGTNASVATGNQNASQNGAQAANQSSGQSGNSHINTFSVTAATQFHHQNANANGAAMTVGSHVRVLATGNHAEKIQILSGNRFAGHFMRHRMSAYYPHVHHHRRP